MNTAQLVEVIRNLPSAELYRRACLLEGGRPNCAPVRGVGTILKYAAHAQPPHAEAMVRYALYLYCHAAQSQGCECVPLPSGAPAPTCAPNKALAKAYFARAAAMGSDNGYFYLALFAEVDENDEPKAIELFKRVNPNEHALVNWCLGYVYQVEADASHGRGKGLANRKAVEYFQRGADMRVPECISNLAYHYLHGLGVPKNAAKALELEEEAAQAGHVQVRSCS
jgi:TPR repeat protein